MKKIIGYLKHRPHSLAVILILSLALFFRTYKVIDRFEFAHDGDLYSWIAKDIIVNHHIRLIGQLTSAPGIFIGPLYYYLNIPFFLLTNMDPIGAIIPITIIGILTVFSYFWVFTKLFNTKIGLITSFLYAVLLAEVQSDRRVVPSTPTNIWVIWYFYSVVSLARGNFKVLPLLGILIGLIWHIHIALAPTLLVIPVAFLLSKKVPKLKQVLLFLTTLIITSLPLLIFEIRHNFSQTISLFKNFGPSEYIGPRGFEKLQQVLNMIVKNINTLFFSPQYFEVTSNLFFIILILLLGFIFIKKKIITTSELILFYVWILGVIIFFTISSSPISEYYFYNIEIIFIFLVSSFFYLLSKIPRVGNFLVIFVLFIVAFKNAHFLVTEDYYHKGYKEKKAVVDYILSDAKSKKIPCFAITYITSPGENVGFRYFFYLKNAHIVKYSQGTPVYNIVIPDEYSKNVEVKFGHIGVETPKALSQKATLEKVCSKPNANLSDPMFGFVE